MPYSPASQSEHCLQYSENGDKEAAFYITERSATTHITVHPKLRLMA